jgi:hypothetical protein
LKSLALLEVEKNWKARAAQMVKKGKLSESEKKKIDAKANKKLGKTVK